MITKREALLQYIESKLKDPRTIIPVLDSTPFRLTTRDPIGHEQASKLQPGEAIVGIYEGPESKRQTSNSMDCTLEVILEFYYKPKLGQGKSTELNRLLGDTIFIMRKDYTQGGNAVNTVEVSNNIDIDGIFDKIINGSIKFEVLYRHGVFDPYSNLC